MSEELSWIWPALSAIAGAAPGAFEQIERWVAGEKAKRVEEVRPSVSHTDQAIADLKRGTSE